MYTYLRDLFEFLWAVINSWAGYSTGGVAVALLSLWSILGRVQYSRRFGIALAEFFLFLAFFNAWRVEHQKRTAIEAMRLAVWLSSPLLQREIIARDQSSRFQESSPMSRVRQA